MSPDIVMGQIWLQDDTTQVEIIELDSDDAEIPSTEKQDYNFGQYWQYVDKDRFSMPEPEIYQANRKAREKRRMMQNLNDSYNDNSPENFENEYAEVVNDIVYSSFYGSTDNSYDTKKNRHPNCFTIINKPFNSDSSSDDIEFINRDTDTSDHVNGDMPYDGEIITFDQDVDSSKRTIWIYSFRNKRLLSENDFELVNIPSQDSASSTSCSLDNFCEEPNVSKNTRRVASPIPATYVPRLNLSNATTLPTVTEITETARSKRDEIPKSVNSPNRHKSNNWLDEKITMNGFHVDKQDTSSNTNIINWMSLSPRERRRRFRNTKISPTYPSKLPVLIEVPSTEPKPDDSFSEVSSQMIQTTAEINIVGEKPKKVETASPISNLQTSGKRDEVIVTKVNGDVCERGDFDKKSLHKPQITIKSGRPRSAVITEPIEKLDSNNWIHEDKRLKAHSWVHGYEQQKVADTSGSEIQELEYTSSDRNTSNACASNRLWARHMTLLKPVAWSEFLPIATSVPSLQLSVESDSAKQSCLKRLVNCFRCFK